MSNGRFINNNNLTDNEKRMGMFNFVKSETTKRNMQPKSIINNKCSTTGQSCDSLSLTRRKNKTIVRQPIRAVRKETECNNSRLCDKTTKLYKDNYSQCDTNTLGVTCVVNNGSLPTGKLNNIDLTKNIEKSTSGFTTRTAKPLIRSGMQPNTAGQQNSGLDNFLNNKKRQTYSYSYRELLNNRRKTTPEKALHYVNSEGNQSGILKYNHGGECVTKSCQNGTVVDRLNNKKFHVQGAVDSSTRLDRLKLQTIRGQSSCPPGTTSQKNNSNCNGDYFGGKPKNLNVNFVNQNTTILSKSTTEKKALMRVRGSISKNTLTNFSKSGLCCDN